MNFQSQTSQTHICDGFEACGKVIVRCNKFWHAKGCWGIESDLQSAFDRSRLYRQLEV